MRLLIRILLLSLSTFILQGCTDSHEKLSLAYKYSLAEKHNDALKELERIKTSFPKNRLLYKKASLLEGEIYFEMDSLDKAEKSFKEVLSETSRAIQITRNLKRKITSYNPYAKLYYDANMYLARLYNSKKQYEKSFSYLQKAEEGSNYFGCGLGKMDEQFRRDSLFVRNHLELENIEPIIEKLGGDIFNLSKEMNYGSVDEIADLIKKHYSSKVIERSLNRVLTSIEKREINVDDIKTDVYFSDWFGQEVRILGIDMYHSLDRYHYDYEVVIDTITEKSYWIPKTEEQLIEMCQRKIKESEIYNELRK